MDISGFTSLTEHLMSKGKEGAEILSSLLDQIFEPLIKAIYIRQGFISIFIGDAFIAVFPDQPEKQNQSANSVWRALYAANEIRQSFKTRTHLKKDFDSFTISVKIGLSTGKINWGIVGKKPPLTYYFRGPAIDGCISSESRCKKMDIVIDTGFYQQLGNLVEVSSLDSDFFKLLRLPDEKNKPSLPLDDSDLQFDILSQFLPDRVLHTKLRGEFRNIVPVFLAFQEFYNEKELRDFSDFVLERVSAFDGFIEGMRFDDKGGHWLILFGFPNSHENDIERAVHFIYSINHLYMDQIKGSITFGSAFTGLIGSQVRSAYGSQGTIVNLAARLLVGANWGEIWISEDIAKKIQDLYLVENLGLKPFKGISKPIYVYNIVEQNIITEQLYEITDQLYENVMVGRDKEILVLEQQLQPIFSGTFAGFAFVYGEAGIGKSRFVNETIDKIGGKIQKFHLKADAIIQKSLNPFVYMLRRYMNQNETMTREQKIKHFEKTFQTLITKLATIEKTKIVQEELLRCKSLLGGLLGLYWPNSLYEQLDPKGRLENTKNAILHFMKSLSLIKSTVFIFEDTQWLDMDSYDTLQTINKNMNNYPLFIIANSRYNDDGSKPVFNINLNVPVLTIELPELDEQNNHRFIEGLMNGPINPDLNSFLYSKTKGNPLYLEQLILYLKEHQFIELKNNLYHMKQKEMEIPSEINAVIISRVDRLSNKSRELAGIASVLGMEFNTKTLTQVIGRMNTFLNLYRLLDKHSIPLTPFEGLSTLRDLLNEGVTERIWQLIVQDKYVFNNALLRDAIYDMQLRTRLKLLHLFSAEAIETLYKNDKTHFEELAYHFEKSEMWDRAAIYLEKAGDYAQELYNNKKALQLYNKIIEILDNDVDIIRIQVKKAELLLIIGEWDQAEHIIRTNIESSKELEDEQYLAFNQTHLAYLLLRKGDSHAAYSILNQAKRLFEKNQYDEGLIQVHGHFGTLYSQTGQYELAMKHLEFKLKIAEKINHQYEIAQSLGQIGIVIRDLKHNAAEAKDYFYKQLKIAEKMNSVVSKANVYLNLGVTYDQLGDFINAINYFNKSIDLFKELGDKSNISSPLVSLGYVYKKMADFDKARDCFQRSLDICEHLGDKVVICQNKSNLAEINTDLYQFHEAVDFYNQAIDIAGNANLRLHLCVNILKKAELYYTFGEYELAKELNQEGLQLAQQLNSKENIFRGIILASKLLSFDDKSLAIKNLKKAVYMISDDEERAVYHLTLYKLSKKVEDKRKAIQLYHELVQKTPSVDVLKRIAELTEDSEAESDEFYQDFE